MKLTLSWLKEFVDLPTDDPEELVEAFESLGHEIEDWHVIEPSFSGVVVGKVIEVGPHPNADQVRLTKVDVGDEVLEIVCGAWNFESGAIVPVAVPDAVLGGDFAITRRDIRGITSNGMICSETELQLGEDAEGIMVLNDDYPDAIGKLGAPFADIIEMPDIYFEVNVTPNRPDCLSVYGLARDLGALYEIPLRDYQIAVTEAGAPSTMLVTISEPDMCPRFAARQVRGITIGTSPHWLRWRLNQAGVRPISNVVDASNYAMIEFGHPTHAFDVERLGNTIDVRMALDGERIVTLDDQERTLTSQDIVVTNGETPVAIGGVMGGASTEVDEGTTDVLIEAAYWNPPNVLMTSKRLGLRSEASMRFERGADPSFCNLGADRVAQLLERIAGGVPAPDPIDVDPGHIQPWTLSYPLSETRRLLGIDLDSATTTRLLERLTFDVAGSDPIAVTVPTRRPDVRRKADLVEEIARLHGFAGIPDTVPSGPGGGLGYRESRVRQVRRIMVGAGFHESLTFSFIGVDDLELLDPTHESSPDSAIAVVNPLNDVEGVMRTSLIPGLLKSAAANLARRLPSAALFEIGKVFLPGGGKLPDQPDRLGFVLAGAIDPEWFAGSQSHDVFDGTGVVDLLGTTLRVPDLAFTQASRPPFHAGRCAEVLIGQQVVGAVGEIDPRVGDAFGLTGRVVVGELDLDGFTVDRGHWQYEPPSVFPPVVFDLAFAATRDVPAVAVLEAARAGAGDLLEHSQLFDVFVGESIGEGMVSYAVNFRLRADDRTLTDDEIGPVRRAIAESVLDATGATLRGEI
ncbi:MAG: phenylalanine--tRNA ligase subunit beta [Acidimicrobiia bacterium]|nr:MAG: phenylalanine--tRNA ligase subunit beta [Acidimicrobiia bacterium]